VIGSIVYSNKINNECVERKLQDLLKENENKICFWGVTYTENTSTLRRSEIYQSMKNLAEKSNRISFVEDIDITDEVDQKLEEIMNIESSINDIDILVIGKKLKKMNNNSKLLEILYNSNIEILDPIRYLLNFMPIFSSRSGYHTVGFTR
jgi:UDP-N-acetyl-D-mannosaminuronate dehydrogenase